MVAATFRLRPRRRALVAGAAVALLIGAVVAIRSRIIANRFVVYLDVSDHRSRVFISHALPRLRRQFGEGLKPRIVVVPMTDDAAPVRGAVAARCAEEQDRQARFIEEWTGAGGGASTEYAFLLAATRAETDLDRFKRCLASDRSRDKVLRLRERLTRKGLRAVPAFEIGKEKLGADTPFGLAASRLAALRGGPPLALPRLTVVADPACDVCPTDAFVDSLSTQLGVKLEVVREDARTQPGLDHARKWDARRLPVFAFDSNVREHLILPDLNPMVEERDGALIVKPDRFPGPFAVSEPPPPLPVPSIGRFGAPIRLRLFCDLEGAGCREFYRRDFPEIKRRFVDSGRLLLEWVPCSWSNEANPKAAREVVCLDRRKRFWKFLEERWGNSASPGKTVSSGCAGAEDAVSPPSLRSGDGEMKRHEEVASRAIVRTCEENRIVAQPSYQIGRLFVEGYTGLDKLEPLFNSPLASAVP